MARVIDEKIIKMSVDDAQFKEKLVSATNNLTTFNNQLKTDNASGIDKSTSAFDRLKTALSNINPLNLLKSKDAATDLSNVSMDALDNNVQKSSGLFSALETVATGALLTIGNQIATTGTNMVKNLSIKPITDGFSEYQTKIQAAQVAMANTGRTEEDVLSTLQELNLYADKTTYSFSDMTQNMGRFTSAGLGLEQSAKSIQGISNLAAFSGATSQQSATAMYQLSQAMSAGTVKLQDWNSVVNANIGGKKFQTDLIDMANSMGIANDASENFRESLKDGWLSSEVLTNVLSNYAEDGTMLEMATQAHTFQQAMDNIAEAAGSGWSSAWESIIGGPEESTKVWTAFADKIGNIAAIIPNQVKNIGAALKNVNKGSGVFKETLSNTDRLKNSFHNLGAAAKMIFKPLTDLFNAIIKPKLTSTTWVDTFSEKFHLFSEFILLKFAPAISNGFDSLKDNLFNSNLWTGMSKVWSNVSTAFSNLGSAFVKAFSNIFKSSKSGNSVLGNLGKTFSNLFSNIDNSEVMIRFVDWITGLSQKFADSTSDVDAMSKKIEDFLEMLSDPKAMIKKFTDGVAYMFKTIFTTSSASAADIGVEVSTEPAIAEASAFSKFIDSIVLGTKKKFIELGAWLKETGAAAIFSGLSSIIGGGMVIYGFTKLTLSISGLVKEVKEIVNPFKEFTNTLKSVSGSFTALTKAIPKVAMAITISAFAGAILAFAVALKVLSTLDANEITSGLAAIIVMLTALWGTYALLGRLEPRQALVASAAITVFTGALVPMSVGLGALSLLDGQKVSSNLLAIGGALLLLYAGFSFISAITKSIKVGVMTGMAKDIAQASKGLTSVQQAFNSMKTQVNMLALAASVMLFVMSLKKLVGVVQAFADIDLKTIGKASLVLLGLVGAFVTVSLVTDRLEMSSFQLLSVGAAMNSIGTALGLLVLSMHFAGTLSLKSITVGLGILAVMITSVIALGNNAMPALKAAASILALSVAMSVMVGSMVGVGILFAILPSLMGNVLMGLSALVIAMASMIAISKMVKLISEADYVKLGAIALILIAFALPMALLSTLDWSGVARGLITLAGSIVILLAAGAIAGIPLVAVGLTLLGVACLNIGIGIGAAAAGIALLVGSISLLIKTITGLKDASFITEEAARTMGRAATEMIAGFVNGLADGLPKMIPAMIRLLVNATIGIADGLAKELPRIIESVGLILYKLITDLSIMLAKAVAELAGPLKKAVEWLFDVKGMEKDSKKMQKEIDAATKASSDQAKASSDAVTSTKANALQVQIKNQSKSDKLLADMQKKAAGETEATAKSSGNKVLDAMGSIIPGMSAIGSDASSALNDGFSTGSEQRKQLGQATIQEVAAGIELESANQKAKESTLLDTMGLEVTDENLLAAREDGFALAESMGVGLSDVDWTVPAGMNTSEYLDYMNTKIINGSLQKAGFDMSNAAAVAAAQESYKFAEAGGLNMAEYSKVFALDSPEQAIARAEAMAAANAVGIDMKSDAYMNAAKLNGDDFKKWVVQKIDETKAPAKKSGNNLGESTTEGVVKGTGKNKQPLKDLEDNIISRKDTFGLLGESMASAFAGRFDKVGELAGQALDNILEWGKKTGDSIATSIETSVSNAKKGTGKDSISLGTSVTGTALSPMAMLNAATPKMAMTTTSPQMAAPQINITQQPGQSPRALANELINVLDGGALSWR
jgi:tape measure domain-containing protein